MVSSPDVYSQAGINTSYPEITLDAAGDLLSILDQFNLNNSF